MLSNTTTYFLDIVEQPQKLFFNAHGGKKAGLTVRVGLFSKDSATGAVARCPRRSDLSVSVHARLLYSSGLEATSLKTEDDLLCVIESRPLGSSENGDARLKFRVEEVSNMHKVRGGDGGKFILELTADAEACRAAGLPAFDAIFTDAFTVKSKDPRIFRKKRKSADAAAAASLVQSDTASVAAAPLRKRATRSRRSRSRVSSSSSFSSSSSSDGEDSDCSIESTSSSRSSSSAASTTSVVSFSVAALATMEWVSIGNGMVQCPCCHSLGPTHRVECALHLALTSASASDADSDDSCAGSCSSSDCEEDTTINLDADDEDNDFLAFASSPRAAVPLSTPVQRRRRSSMQKCTAKSAAPAASKVDELFVSPIPAIACVADDDADSSMDMDFWMVHGMLEKHAVSSLESQRQKQEQQQRDALDKLFSEDNVDLDLDLDDQCVASETGYLFPSSDPFLTSANAAASLVAF
eukprot:INCI10145.1.p1 GENE.INCI10145.1~~INCI10145.1.p1  ORF type:complete len:467 (+),score=114.82 INCI10145.1:160-1560(+)